MIRLRLFVVVLTLVCVCGLLGPLAAFAGKPVARNLTVSGDKERTTIIVDLSEAADFTASVLPEPYRLVLEFKAMRFALPKAVVRTSAGLVKRTRYGRLSGKAPSIVIDTTGPVLIEKSELLPRAGKTPPRIRIELVPTNAETFANVYAQDNASVPASKPSQAPELTGSLPVLAGHVAPPEASTHTSEKRVIVIDPGHGGMDPGAISPSNTKEKDVVFEFAKELMAALGELGKYTVKLTRDTDRFMSLKDRVKFAREQKADLLISIHADIVRGQTAQGTTIYTLSDKASDAEAAAFAKKENAALGADALEFGLENAAVEDVLVQLVQRETKNYSMLFSKKALVELKEVTTLTGKPLRSASFLVLRAPDVPSVLIELGFLSSKVDEAKLLSVAWRKKTAGALARAIDLHFEGGAAAPLP